MSKQVYWRFKDSRYWTLAEMHNLGNGLVNLFDGVVVPYKNLIVSRDEIDVKEVVNGDV